ncbi:hypothetical protein Esti_001684 [Eimeria stiedai]
MRDEEKAERRGSAEDTLDAFLHVLPPPFGGAAAAAAAAAGEGRLLPQLRRFALEGGALRPFDGHPPLLPSLSTAHCKTGGPPCCTGAPQGAPSKGRCCYCCRTSRTKRSCLLLAALARQKPLQRQQQQLLLLHEQLQQQQQQRQRRRLSLFRASPCSHLCGERPAQQQQQQEQQQQQRQTRL